MGSRRFLLFAFASFYLLNCFAPLRLEYDSIHYFSLKDCLENACPIGFNPSRDWRPRGYSVVLWALDRLGILHAFVIAALNVFFLAGSLFFIRGCLPSVMRSFALFPLVLLQWTFIKFFAYPLSEMLYLFFSTGSLYCFRLYEQSAGDQGEQKPLQRQFPRGAWLLAAGVGACLAIFTRTAGIVLLPALLAGTLRPYWPMLKEKARRNFLLLAAVGVVCLGGIFYLSPFLSSNLYWKSIRRDNPGISVLLTIHFREWGQLLLNIPGSKVTASLHGWGNPLLVIAGIGLGILFFYGLFIRRKEVPIVLSLYLLLYILLFFNWHFYDARFWIPVWPFMVMMIFSLKDRVRGRIRALLKMVWAVYLFMGLGAAGYSTYTAFNKPVMARTQAGGLFRNEYETYFFGKPINDTATRTDPYVLSVLKRYN